MHVPQHITSQQLKKSDSLPVGKRGLAESQAKLEIPPQTLEASASEASLSLKALRYENEEATGSSKRPQTRELQAWLSPEAATQLTSRVAELEAALAAAQAEHRVAARRFRHELQLAKESSSRLKTCLNDALATLEATKAKNAYRLGEMLAIGVQSPAGLLALPAKLLSLWREVRGIRRARAESGATPYPAVIQSGSQDLEFDKLIGLLKSGGLAAVKARLQDEGGGADRDRLAFQMLKASKAAADAGDSEAEFELAQAALALCRSEMVLRGFHLAAESARRFEPACQAIRDLERLYGDHARPQQREVLAKLRNSPAYQLTVLDLVVDKPTRPIVGTPGRICYVLHSSLPYSSGGYGTRSQGVAGSLLAAGQDLVVLTRPGFPLDIKPELVENDVPYEDVIDGVRYLRTLEPKLKGVSTLQYVAAAADTLERQLRNHCPQFVIAASNHVTALPALIAARRLGLPFIYEIRGLWEITRASREKEYGSTAAFHLESLLETKVAQLADHVFTLTEAMREELVGRGVDASKIDLLPNSCDPSRFMPRERDQALANRLGIPPAVPVIGYVGTFVDYEGLEDLALACAELKHCNIAFRLMLVGNENASGPDRGSITEQILAIAKREGLSDWLIMPGRVPHEQVETYYSLIDIAPFPRKPWPVCEMVSPLKPLEALSMEKAVLVSDVRALAEIVHAGETGMHFRKGDIGSLVGALRKLLLDPELRLKLGQAGRRWVMAERTWRHVGDRVATLLGRLARARAAPSTASS